MGLGRVLAPRFQPCTLSVGWAAPSAAPDFFLHNSPAALAELRGDRHQLAAAAASQWVSDVCSLWIPSRHIGALSVGACGAWAPRAALDLLFARCTGGAGRWRGQGLVADQWPQPRHGDGRACIESASERFGRPWRSENRECIESTSESAPRCADLLVSRAREAIRKIASALNLHLKGRRLAQAYASYARARRRRRCSFWRIRLAARRGSGEELRGRADCWPPPRQANGAARPSLAVLCNNRKICLAHRKGRKSSPR